VLPPFVLQKAENDRIFLLKAEEVAALVSTTKFILKDNKR
jgi:predicted RNA methylase